MFSYVDAVVKEVADVFETERDQYIRSRAQRSAQMVRDALDGAYFDATELGYDLLGRHIAVAADGPDAEAALRRWAVAQKVQSLIVGTNVTLAWGWLAAAVIKALPSPPETRFGVGDALAGPDGFRAGHHQAVLACAVAARFGVPACRYDDVALEASALSDESAARRFVQRELGLLAGPGERNGRLRATMSSYLQNGHNAAIAAKALNITHRTVAYRLHTCEELLGKAVPTRATELAMALRWGRLLGMFD